MSMDITIHTTFLPQDDPEAALGFYRDTLGFELRNDVGYQGMRWLTVGPPDQPDVSIVLMAPGAPVHDDATAAQLRELIAKGACGGLILHTDDCDATYRELRAKGVEFTQEPVERFYGIDCALRDPSGNPLRLTQPPAGPVVVPSAEELQGQVYRLHAGA